MDRHLLPMLHVRFGPHGRRTLTKGPDRESTSLTPLVPARFGTQFGRGGTADRAIVAASLRAIETLRPHRYRRERRSWRSTNCCRSMFAARTDSDQPRIG